MFVNFINQGTFLIHILSYEIKIIADVSYYGDGVDAISQRIIGYKRRSCSIFGTACCPCDAADRA